MDFCSGNAPSALHLYEAENCEWSTSYVGAFRPIGHRTCTHMAARWGMSVEEMTKSKHIKQAAASCWWVLREKLPGNESYVYKTYQTILCALIWSLFSLLPPRPSPMLLSRVHASHRPRHNKCSQTQRTEIKYANATNSLTFFFFSFALIFALQLFAISRN